MSDFVESAKNFVNSAVSRTGWEAQKQLRVHGKQGEIDKLLEQRQKLLDEMVQAAMSLYQQSMLSDPQLSRLCASVLELDNDVRKREQQLQDIKNEPYPAEQFAPGPTANYTPPPSSSTPPQPNPTNPSYTPGSPSDQQAMERCSTCGGTVRAGSLYCRNCGAKLR
ncbi:MAG TPA: hypothetical protein VH593_27825 [Ktedonobacteraceae bacterium]|jgi:hypothetical protein